MESNQNLSSDAKRAEREDFDNFLEALFTGAPVNISASEDYHDDVGVLGESSNATLTSNEPTTSAEETNATVDTSPDFELPQHEDLDDDIVFVGESSGSIGSAVNLPSRERHEPPQSMLIPCKHEMDGCKLTFTDYILLSGHAKECIYKIFRWCHDPDCVEKGLAKFDKVLDLVNHALKEHDCVMFTGKTVQLPFRLPRAFLDCKGRDFSTRFLAAIRVKEGSTWFRVVITALVKSNVLIIVPLQYGIPPTIDNLVTMTLTLSDGSGKGIIAYGDLAHSSQKMEQGTKVLCSAFSSPGLAFKSIGNKNVPTYRLKDVIGNSDGEEVELKLCVNIETTRCRVLWKDEPPMKPYMVTWNETGLDMTTWKTLLSPEKVDKALGITGVLLPQFIAEYNMLIECNADMDVVLGIWIAGIGIKKRRKQHVGQPYSAKAMVLFSSSFMLVASAEKIKEKAEAVGLVVKNIQDNLPCDIVLTTCDQITSFKSFVLLRKVKNVFFPFLDGFFPSNIENCFQHVPDKWNPRVRICVCPCVDETVMTNIEQNFFKAQFKPVSVGPSPDKVIAGMEFIEVACDHGKTKEELVVEIIEQNVSTGGWLVIANESEHNYTTVYDAITSKLNESEKHWKILRCNESDAQLSVPNEFEMFQQNSVGSVLLTTEFAVCFDHVQNCGATIILTDRKLTKAHKLGLRKFSLGGKKMIYVVIK